MLAHDGVALAYIQAGSGKPSLMFLHGWATDHMVLTQPELPLVSWSRERFEVYYSQKEGEQG
jgi:hypothetical protein